MWSNQAGAPPTYTYVTAMFFHLDKETGRHSLEAQVVTPMSRSMTLEVSKDAFTAAWQQSESPSRSTKKKKAKKKKKTKTNDLRGSDANAPAGAAGGELSRVDSRVDEREEQRPPQTHRIPSSPPSSPARHKRPAYIHGDRPNTLDTRSPLPDMYAERKARSEAKKEVVAMGGVHGEPTGRAGQDRAALVENQEGKGDPRAADETAGLTAGTPRSNGKRGLLKPPPGSPKPPPPPPTPSKKSTLLKPPPGSPRPPPPPPTPSSSSKDEAPPTTRNGTATSAATRTAAHGGADGGADGVAKIEKATRTCTGTVTSAATRTARGGADGGADGVAGIDKLISSEPRTKLTPTQQYLKHFLERAGVEGDYAEDLEEALAMSATAAGEAGETGETEEGSTEETGTTGELGREKEEGKGNDEERSHTRGAARFREGLARLAKTVGKDLVASYKKLKKAKEAADAKMSAADKAKAKADLADKKKTWSAKKKRKFKGKMNLKGTDLTKSDDATKNAKKAFEEATAAELGLTPEDEIVFTYAKVAARRRLLAVVTEVSYEITVAEDTYAAPATPEPRDVITITIATADAELGVKVSPFGGIVTKVKDHPFLRVGDKLVQVGETAVPVDVTSGVAAHMIMTAIYPLALRFRRGASGEVATAGEGEKGASAGLLDHSNDNESHTKRGEGFELPVDHPHENQHQRQQHDHHYGSQGGPLMKLPAWVLPWVFGETEEGLRDMVRFVRYLHDHVDQLASEDGSEEEEEAEETDDAEKGSAVGGDAKGGAMGSATG